MLPTTTAASLIAGMIQTTRSIGPQWDSLPEEERTKLVTRWERAIAENPDEAAPLIIDSIAGSPRLAEAWNDLGDAIHHSHALIIQAIIANTHVA